MMTDLKKVYNHFLQQSARELFLYVVVGGERVQMMKESAMLQQRRLARQEKALIDQRLIDLHIKAASVLDDTNGSARDYALQQITKWEQERLCNKRYIRAWRTILNLPPQARRAAMLREDAEGIALRQNSPFGFLVEKDHEPR